MWGGDTENTQNKRKGAVEGIHLFVFVFVFVMLLLLHFFLRDDEWWINHQTTKSDDVKHGTIISLLYRITQIVWYYCVIKYYKMLKPIFLFFYMKPPTRYNLSCLRHADTRQKEFAICLLAAGMTWKDEGRTRLIVYRSFHDIDFDCHQRILGYRLHHKHAHFDSLSISAKKMLNCDI